MLPFLLIVAFSLGIGFCIGIIFRATQYLRDESRKNSSFAAKVITKALQLRTKKQYQQRARFALPAFMETLAMLLSAGYPISSALQRMVSTASDQNSSLHVEIREVLRRTRTGESFAEALSKLKAELPGPEIAMFVGLLAQANQHGGRLADLLNQQADVRRQQIAEEIETRAQEAPVRLLLPLIAFIFPATMLPFIGVILGKLMWQT